jgi:uncharacterized membrane protein YkoI
MKVRMLVGSGMAVALLGLGILLGSVLGASGVSAQTPTASSTPTPNSSKSAPATPNSANVKITQQQAEQAALAASPGNTVDHTRLGDQNGTAIYDVDFTNGGGVVVNAETGAIVATEAAGTDKGGPRGGGPGGADQAALAAKATVTQQQAEQAALAASPGNTVDHSRLGDDNGTVFWDVDFTNGGGVKVNAQTGAIIATEAAGTDHPGGRPGGPPTTKP